MLLCAHGVSRNLVVNQNVTMITIDNMLSVFDNMSRLLCHDCCNWLGIMFAVQMRVNKGVMHCRNFNIISSLVMRVTQLLLMDVLCVQLHFFNLVHELFVYDRMGWFVHLDHLNDFFWLHL